ncbi:MAG: arylesterase [Oxalobacter sp.]|nr:MAG: arylesterase [Oxalobacter sp.]
MMPCFIATIIMLFCLVSCGRQPKMASVPPGSVVLAFGDSVTYGTGAQSGEDWPTLLAQKTRWQIVNAGIPGDTALNGKDRIAALLEQHRPVLVIIEIGGNDFLRRRSHAAVKEDIRQIITTSRSSGAEIVLVAVPEFSMFAVVAEKPSDAPLYAELGKEEKIPVIAGVFSGVLSQMALRADTIHPNAKGYRVMADGLFAELKKIGLYRE